MKSIKKIKESSKAVAGTALLVGATLAGGAAFATASSHGGSSGSGSMTLGDYPSPFIGEDGTVDSTIVMGENAKATDVVAASNIAGQLGNDAFTTEMVSAGGGASFGWSATNGETLDTRNDQLYYGQQINKVRQTLTGEHLTALSDYEFQDDAGDNTEVEFYLKPGSQSIQYGTDDADDTDPFLYIDNPSSPSNTGSYLYHLQANFEGGLNFTHTDVEGEEIELFGNTYTIGESNAGDEVTLYGNQDEVSINSGSSSTITIDGEEHTIEVVAVTSSNTAAFRIDGTLRQKDDGQTFSVDGQDVRITDVIQTNSQNSEGVVTYAVGSQEIVLTNGDVEDSDGDQIDGVSYTVNSGSTTGFGDVSTLNFYVGAEDDDTTYVAEGESYSHSLFDNVEFKFGGLNPDATEDSDQVSEVEFGTNGDDTATVSFNSEGESATMQFLYGDTDGDGDVESGDLSLATGDNETIATHEGQMVREDDYVSTDAGDFAHMWKVTGVDLDDQDPAHQSGTQQASIDLRDAVTGSTVEVDIDEDTPATSPEYQGTEVIDGQTYNFAAYNGSSTDSDDDSITVNWGSSDDTHVYTPIDLQSGGALAFTNGTYAHTGGHTSTGGHTFVLPSTDSTDTRSVSLNYTTSDNNADSLNVTTTSSGVSATTAQDGTPGNAYTDVTVSNGATYRFVADGTGLHVMPAGTAGTSEASALVLEPEDDSDSEEGYFMTPVFDSSGPEVAVDQKPTYTGTMSSYKTLDSDDNVDTAYSTYGTYVEANSDDQGSATLNLPNGQATAGAAFTGADGSLSGSASGAGTVESMSPTGWPANSVALDSDSYVSNAKQNSNLILVGGPAANSLVSELASANKTWEASQYTDGQGMLQLVEDAFSEDHDALIVAGYSGEDTRQAGAYLTNYEQHSDMLSGKDQVSINTAEGTVVQ